MRGIVPVIMGNNVKLKKKAPSPAGEGWGEENKNRGSTLYNHPHPNLLPLGEGTVLSLLNDIAEMGSISVFIYSQLDSGEILWK